MKWSILLVLLLLLPCSAHGRILFQGSSTGIDRGPVLVSDGVQETASRVFIVKPSSETGLQRLLSSSSCDETYGFMPCTTTIVGNLFLLAAYGYLLFKAATFITNGCELLLSVMGPGIIGGLFLPILGAFPDALLIAVSGLSGSTATAQSQVLIGMGLLAGSTVMLLTALWGACTIVGKCDLSEENVAIDGQDTKRFNLSGSGITTDKATAKASQIMVVSLIPFIIVEIPQVIDSSSAKRIGVLVGCIAAIICLISYCVYQIIQPWIQKRRMAYAKHKHIISTILNVVHSKGRGRLLREDGQPDQDVLEKIFKDLDNDNDGYLTRRELHGLLVGLEWQDDPQSSTSDAVNKVMAEFDSSRDEKLSLEEFKAGMSSWLKIATSTVGRSKSNNYSRKFLSSFQSRSKEEVEALENADEEDVTEVDNRKKIYLKAVMLMLGGAIIAGIFADPLVDAVDNFSDATSIPSFFISFIIMPLATNSSEGVSALIFASRKKKRTASLTYSEIYGAVTMNNTLCLGVFLAIIYIRGLDWDFSAEVLVIVLVVLVMGLLGSFRTTFPLWMSFFAFLFYPLTLAIVYVLDYVLGWS